MNWQLGYPNVFISVKPLGVRRRAAKTREMFLNPEMMRYMEPESEPEISFE